MSESEVIPLQYRPHEEYYRSIFNQADANGDGFITLAELSSMIRNNNLSGTNVPIDIIERIHSISDTNHDGQLNYEEFVKMLHNPRYKSLFGRYINLYINSVIPRRPLTDAVDSHYEEEYSCWPPKLGMILISIIEAIFFIIDAFYYEVSTETATGPMAKALIYDPYKRSEVWRFLTYMLVHIGHLHLVVNLVVQLLLGLPLEMVHGWKRVLGVYLAGGIAGSLLSSVIDPYVKVAGASGGVYALMTAHIATIIMNWREMTFPLIQLMIFVLIIGTDVGSAIYGRYTGEVETQVAYIAHLGGALAGLFVGIGVLRNLKWSKKETVLWWISLAICAVFVVVVIFIHIFDTGIFPTQV